MHSATGKSATTSMVVIEGWLPHATVNARHHWAAANRNKRADQYHVMLALATSDMRRIRGKARLTVTFIFPVKRTRDIDNLYARAKSTIDVLVRGGYIVDDSTDMLELRVQAEYERGVARTIIELEKA